MIDLFALAVSHLVLALMVGRLMRRRDLDDDPALPRNFEEPGDIAPEGHARP